MLDEAFERFPRQVEPVESRVAVLKLGDDAQRLGIVIEAAIRPHRPRRAASSPVWPKGVWPRSCAKASASARSSSRPSARARARAIWPTSIEWVSRVPVMIALVRDENLRLMGETAEGRRMEDAVAVTLEFTPRRRSGLRQKPAPAAAGIGGIGRAPRHEGGRRPSGRDGFGVWRQSRVPFAKLSQGAAARPASLQMARLRHIFLTQPYASETTAA